MKLPAIRFGNRVAPAPGGAYWARVTSRRLLSLLFLFALVVAPAGMIGASPAMATTGPAMAPMSHETMAAQPCHQDEAGSDQKAPGSNQEPQSCCVTMCVAIAAMGGELAPHAVPTAIRESLLAGNGLHGLGPEADPPPPRTS